MLHYVGISSDYIFINLIILLMLSVEVTVQSTQISRKVVIMHLHYFDNDVIILTDFMTYIHVFL